MIVPLGIGSYRRSLLPEVVLKNMIVEKDKSGLSPDGTIRRQRPGLVQIDSYNAALRAMLPRDGAQLVVAGGTFYRNHETQGAIAGSGSAPIVSTPFATFVVGGTTLYAYTDTLAPVVLPDDTPDGLVVQDVDQLNGYAIALQPGGRFYWIVPGETTIDPLNFATAESLPDKAVAVRRLGDEFWIFGADNVEVWQPTGDLDAPFQRAAGRNFERGCLYRDAVRRFDNTLVWIGDDAQVYRASSVPQVISDNGIAERIQSATGPCSAWTFGMDGHSYYVLAIPGQGTFAYDAATQQWSEFSSPNANHWRATMGYADNGVVVAACDDGTICRVDPEAYGDNGLVFERVVTATVPLTGKVPRNDSASIGIGASADADIRLRWRDGQDDYPAYYEPLEAHAPFDVAQMWRLGIADQPYRTFEVSTVAPAFVTIAGMRVNEGWA